MSIIIYHFNRFLALFLFIIRSIIRRARFIYGTRSTSRLFYFFSVFYIFCYFISTPLNILYAFNSLYLFEEFDIRFFLGVYFKRIAYFNFFCMSIIIHHFNHCLAFLSFKILIAHVTFYLHVDHNLTIIHHF